MRLTPAALVAALGLAGAAAPALAASDDLVPVADGAAAARPSLSADGRLMAFASSDGTRALVRDVGAGTTQVVAEVPAGSGGAVGAPVLSDSGRFACVVVADPGDTGPRVVVRDLAAGLLVSAQPATVTDDVLTQAQAAADPDPGARDCDVSDDGTRVAFVTRAGLDPVDAGDDADVYVLDRSVTPQRTVLVSRATGATGAPGDGPSLAPVLTPGGRHVAFRSFARNLAAGDDDARGDVFVRDLAAATTTWVSRADGPEGGAGTAPTATPASGATGGSMSADGRLVAFASGAGLTQAVSSGPQVYVRDTTAGTTRVESDPVRILHPSGMVDRPPAGASDPELSPDGRWLAFQGTTTSYDPVQPGAVTPAAAAVLRDRLTGRTRVISRQSGIFGALLPDSATSASLSAGGAVAAFAAGGRILRRELDPARPLPVDLVGPPRLILPEVLPGLAVPGGRPAAGGLGGAVALQLSEYAQLRTTLATGERGRTVRGVCVADTSATRLAPACVRYGPAAPAAALDGLEGTTTTTSAALLGTASPAAGRYQLTVTATDLSGWPASVTRDVEAGSPGPLDRFGHLDLRRPILSGARRGRRLRIPVACDRLEVACRTSISVLLGRRSVTRGTVRLEPGTGRTAELPVGRRDSLRLRGRGRAVRATVVLTTTDRGTERIPVRIKRASVFKLLPARG